MKQSRSTENEIVISNSRKKNTYQEQPSSAKLGRKEKKKNKNK